ncbi:LOW QUALITY PROTEIN: CD209 antigen [Choloepus didactylus]|uniref:LOW QUALITY PROTEIN: CD209 antigen n=1 Tax=Choloepus didactylus TaxID=27675 RepID=UPI0018A0CE62|nr:LOW QUALITY PROTEIN: CD209 antigen [Choloepus didactylus]
MQKAGPSLSFLGLSYPGLVLSSGLGCFSVYRNLKAPFYFPEDRPSPSTGCSTAGLKAEEEELIISSIRHSPKDFGFQQFHGLRSFTGSPHFPGAGAFKAGGDLPGTGLELNFLQLQTSKSNRFTWMGLSDLKHEGTWRWLDGSPLLLSFMRYWNKGEPNRSGEEDCAEFRGDGWNDSICNLSKFWICKKAAVSCSSDEDQILSSAPATPTPLLDLRILPTLVPEFLLPIHRG